MARRTQAIITEAFIDLLTQKPLDKITIRELADDCGLKRQAFYYHFQDIYDLLDKWLDRKKNQFFAMTQLTGSWTDRLKVLLHAMQENPKLGIHRFLLFAKPPCASILIQQGGSLLKFD